MKTSAVRYILFLLCMLPYITAEPIKISSWMTIDTKVPCSRSVCISKNNTFIAYGCENGEINIWEVATAKNKLKMESESEITHLVFSNDVSKLFSAEKNGDIICWDLKTGNKEIIGKDQVTFMTVSPNDENIVTANGDIVKVWSIEEKNILREFKDAKFEIRTACYSSDGELFCFPNKGEIIIKKMPLGSTFKKISAHDSFMDQLNFSQDGKQIISSGWDKKVNIWDVSTGEKIFSTSVAGSARFFSICPNGTVLFVNYNEIASINLETGEYQTLEKYHHCKAFAFSDDYRFFVGAHSEGLKLWTVELGKQDKSIKKIVAISPVKIQLKESKLDLNKVSFAFQDSYQKIKPNKLNVSTIFSEQKSSITSVKFSPDEKTFATSDSNGEIYVWSLDKQKNITKVKAHDGGTNDVVFSPDGNYLISGGKDATVKIWNTESFDLFGTIDFEKEVKLVDINSQGDLAIGNNFLKIYNVHKGEISHVIRKNGNSIYCLQFHPTKRLLAVLDYGGIIIYDLDSNSSVATLNDSAYVHFSFSVDGTKLITATKTKISIFSTDTWKQTYNVDSPPDIKTVFLSPDNSIVGAYNRLTEKFYFWSLESKKEILIENNKFSARSMNISSSFNYIIAGGYNQISVQQFANSSQNKIISIKTQDIVRSKPIDQLIEPKTKSSLKNSIVILPFTINDKYDYLGSYMALASLFQATYTPEQVLGTSLYNMETLFATHHILFSKKIVDNKYIQENLQNYCNTQNILHGNILYRNKSYQVQLKFYGEYGALQTEKEFSKSELNLVPNWVASVVHQYLKTSLTETQKEYCKKVHYKNSQVFKKAAYLYVQQRLNQNEGLYQDWEQLLSENPENIFLLGAYAHGHNTESSKLKALEYYKKYPNHSYITDILISCYLKQRDYYRAEETILPLLTERFADVYLYEQAISALRGQKKWQKQQDLILYLETKAKNSYWFHCLMGKFYIEYAWDARGNGWAYTVTEKQFVLFKQRLQQAEEHFVAAYKINPNCADAPTEMITVCMGLGYPKVTMEVWFQRATQKKSYISNPYLKKWEYLKPKWHGSEQELLQFAQEIEKEVPEYCNSRLLAIKIYRELYNFDVDKKTWNAIKNISESYIKEYSGEFNHRSTYQTFATAVGDYQVAAKQYLELEKLDRIAHLENSKNYQDLFKFDLYIAISNAYKQKKDKIKTKKYLQKALHLNARDWQSQNIYADFLVEEERYVAAKEHYTAVIMGDSSNTQKSYAKAKIGQMDPVLLRNQITNFPKLSQKKIYLQSPFFPEYQKLIFQSHCQNIEKVYGIKVEFLSEEFTPSKNAFIFERSEQITPLYEHFEKVMGKIKMEQTANYLGVKSNRSVNSDEAIIKFLLQQTNKGKVTWEEIEKNYTNYYYPQILAYELKKKYTHLLDQDNNLGVLYILNNVNLGLPYNKKLFAYGEKNIGIISFANIFEPKEKQEERIAKQLFYAIAKILDLPESTIPNCPLTFPSNLEELDKQNISFCFECSENIESFSKQINNKK